MKKKPKKEAIPIEEQDLVIPLNRKIGSCMTHRSDIVWIDASSKKSGILEAVLAHPEYGYFPVCSNTVDSVLGVLPARAFLASLQETSWPGLKALVKKPVYLPETVPVVKALSTISESECRMAFIIDEYGGIEGLVTRNGLLGELLDGVSGGLGDEDPDLFRREDGSYLVGGQVRMDEIRELFDLPDLDGGNRDYYTLAGYILALNGSIPKTGDRISAGSWQCEIVDMDGHRIDKVLVSKISAPAEVDGVTDVADESGE